jgi:hypothetical protein
MVRLSVAGGAVDVTVEHASRLAERLHRWGHFGTAHSASRKIGEVVEDGENEVALSPEEEGALLLVVEAWVNCDSEDTPADIRDLRDTMVSGLSEL